MADTHKINLRLPLDLRDQAAELAEYHGLSLNAFVVMALRQQVDYLNSKLKAQGVMRERS